MVCLGIEELAVHLVGGMYRVAEHLEEGRTQIWLYVALYLVVGKADVLIIDKPLPIHTKHFRLQLDMDGAAHWDIREIHFIDAEGNERDVLPSNTFSSMWMSNGGGEQWIYTDLGRRLPIEEVRLHWYQAPRKGAVEVSDNARDWVKAADLQNDSLIRMKTTARYVRLLLLEPGDAGYYALREMKVMSPATKCYTPLYPTVL